MNKNNLILKLQRSTILDLREEKFKSSKMDLVRIRRISSKRFLVTVTKLLSLIKSGEVTVIRIKVKALSTLHMIQRETFLTKGNTTLNSSQGSIDFKIVYRLKKHLGSRKISLLLVNP